MVALAHYLFAIAWSGFYSNHDWQSWADNQILKLPSVEEWIYEVSLSNNLDDLCKVLSDKIIDEKHGIFNLNLISDAVIGYYYILYLQNEISLFELLLKSGDEADGGEATIECEEFYEMLNAIKKNNKLLTDNKFVKNVELLYEPFKIIAERQKRELEEF